MRNYIFVTECGEIIIPAITRVAAMEMFIELYKGIEVLEIKVELESEEN